jgi:dephospho-CoA kinase
MIIGLSGYAQSGKDTVANYLVEHHGFIRIAFADPIREALYNLDPVVTDIPELSGMHLKWLVDGLGWERIKIDSPQVREMLQRFGTEVARNLWSENFWVDLAMSKAKLLDNVVITDVRYPNELDAIRDVSGSVWRVEKPGVSAVNSHTSETALDGYVFDEIVRNAGSLEDLHAKINNIISR